MEWYYPSFSPNGYGPRNVAPGAVGGHPVTMMRHHEDKEDTENKTKRIREAESGNQCSCLYLCASLSTYNLRVIQQTMASLFKSPFLLIDTNKKSNWKITGGNGEERFKMRMLKSIRCCRERNLQLKKKSSRYRYKLISKSFDQLAHGKYRKYLTQYHCLPTVFKKGMRERNGRTK